MSKSKDEYINMMLGAISDKYDKSEGSFLYDAVVGVATALEDFSVEQDINTALSFVETAYDEYLDMLTSALGIERNLGSKATTIVVVTGVNGTAIPINSRFFAGDVVFVATEEKTITGGPVSLKVECEEVGAIGNVEANTIVGFDIDSVSSVTNPSAVTNGEDPESNEELRQRYYARVQRPSASGNVYDYMNWCTEVAGVGEAAVIPVWNGAGTVKCVLVNNDKRAVDSLLIDEVTANVEEKRPIGASVTVVSATELPLNISVDVEIESGYTIETVQSNVTDSLTDYLQEVALKTTNISYAIIGAKILSAAGVVDYQNLTVNGGTANITVANTEVAVVGTVDVT